MTILILSFRVSEINLIVVSEKIIINKPNKKVNNFIFLKFESSFETTISINGISIKKGI